MTDLVLARKWIDALRSGEYTQTFGQLTKDYESFCCLGVACEVANYAHAKGIGNSGYRGEPLTFEDVGVHVSKLPHSLTARLGLLRADGTLHLTDDITLRLSELNDISKFTFAQIADVLEFYYFGNETA